MQNQPAGRPVFVDRTGRRRRLTVIVGTLMGLGLLASLGLILAGLFTDSTVRLPGWGDQKGHPPIEAGLDGMGGTESPSPSPSTSAPAPGSTRTATPTARPTGTDTAAPSARPTEPGQGEEHRNTARPSRSPGKPR
ncbi:hypothetical protein ABGB16_28820 [Micromonospora sp. B11E3]|uniref:hypothetical protein n=1 Tax=Micromonospora sp. B11E3 TaxID=3153562 RepID=UPI00325DA808